MIWLQRFLQYGIGTILLATGIGKLLDVPGFMQVLRTYEAFPYWAEAPIAVTFVLVELRLAEELFRGRHLQKAAIASVVLHTAFTFWAAFTLLRGLDIPNCGCFGVFLARPLTWGTVVEDLIMTAASVGLVFCARFGPNRSQ